MKYPLLPYGDLPQAEDRSHDSNLAAMERNQFFEGQKGPSEVMLLEHFDLAKGNGMDDLHPFYEGVTAFLTDLLINSLGNPGQTLGVANRRMQQVRTPVQMSRKWFSIFKRANWKGSQWGYFIRYHAVLCFLDNNLPAHHVEHISMLSYALFVFSQDSIDPADLQRADQNIERFLALFQEYHGAENMRFNVHMLSHAAQSRRLWAPFWTTSTFNFESWNRQLGLWVTSPKSAADQVVARHFLKIYVHSAAHREDISEHVRNHISDQLFATKRKIAAQLEPEIFGLGSGKRRVASARQSQLLRGQGILNRDIVVYDRILRSCL
ncbi:hypothetical protein ONE63_009531 [Megalurothrips usitatus]|uniref:Uncharacterized protein n=1 Tax=Megalurothrips usitatus TaxID=439358 RepID=A0AAV7XJX4_9NEOP|nr:hypothetical protein ONE63_009531 [Megalurothrips usitatus]